MVGSLGFGAFQGMKASEAVAMIESSSRRAEAAESEARKQQQIANLQRMAAERSAEEARAAMYMADQAKLTAKRPWLIVVSVGSNKAERLG